MLDWFYCFSNFNQIIFLGVQTSSTLEKVFQRCLNIWFPSIRPTYLGPPASATIAMLHGWIILGRHGHTFWSFHGHGFRCFLLGWWRLAVSLAVFRGAARADKFHKNFTTTSKGIHLNKGKCWIFLSHNHEGPPPTHNNIKHACWSKQVVQASRCSRKKQVELPGAK